MRDRATLRSALAVVFCCAPCAIAADIHADASSAPAARVDRAPLAVAPAPLPPSCAKEVVRPTHGSGGGWHRVQYNLEDAYCAKEPGKLFGAILAPGARGVTENHFAGALFTDLYARNDATAARTWLRAQVDGDFQGTEQSGGYTNYYRADVLAGLRWAAEHGDQDLVRLATTWLRRSYALDLLHTAPGMFEVTVPCSRMKLYNRDGREMSLRLLAGEVEPREIYAARRWQYPAYDDVRWLADAIVAGRLRVDPDAAAWARRRDRGALKAILAVLDGMKLRSPLRWVLLDSGAWYSFAPNGIADSASRQVDAVAVTADGEVTELLRMKGDVRVPVREDRGRLVTRLPDRQRELPLPSGRAVLTVDVGRGDRGGMAGR